METTAVFREDIFLLEGKHVFLSWEELLGWQYVFVEGDVSN